MADQPLAAPVLRRVIIIDEKGEPSLTVQPALTRAHITSLYSIVAAQPYTPDPDVPGDAKYEGMTIAEVMIRKQIELAARTGSLEAVEIVMDRLIGRPKSSSENVNVNLSGSYEEFLRKKAAEIIDGVKTVDAEIVGGRDPHPTDSQGNFDDNEIEIFGDLR